MWAFKNQHAEIRCRRRNWNAWFPNKHAVRESFYPGVYATRIYN